MESKEVFYGWGEGLRGRKFNGLKTLCA